MSNKHIDMYKTELLRLYASQAEPASLSATAAVLHVIRLKNISCNLFH
jgi:hypothetical protein